MTKERKAMLLMLVTASMWSIGGIFIKLISWNPFVIAGFRSLFAGITVLIYILVSKKKIVFTKKSVLSMFFLAATFLSFVASNKLTTAANAIVLQFTSSVFVMLFELIFKKQKFKTYDIVTVILTFIGISLFVLDGIESGNMLGNFVGLLTGVFMASMFISVGESEGDEKFSGIFLGQSLTALIGLSFIFFYPPEMNIKMLSYAAILGVFQLGIPYVLFAVATKNCPPFACSLIAVAEPILNPVWVALFMNEYPSKIALIGGIIVIATVTSWCIIKEKRK